MTISKGGKTKGRQFDNKNKITNFKKGSIKGRQFNNRDKKTNLKNEKTGRKFNNIVKKPKLIKEEPLDDGEDNTNLINGKLEENQLDNSDDKTDLKKIKIKKERRLKKKIKLLKQTIHEDVADVFNIMDQRKISFKVAFSVACQKKALSTQVYAAGSQAVNNLTLCDSVIEKCGLQKYSNKEKNVMRAIISDFVRGRSDPFTKEKNTRRIYSILNEKKDLLIKLKEECDKPEERVLTPTFVRVNTLLCTVDKFLDHLNKFTDFKLIDTPSTYKGYLQAINELELSTYMIDYHFKNLLVFSNKAKNNLWNSDFYKYSNIVFQDKSSVIGAEMLQVKPGHLVLDMCAAPGMKTVLMAANLEGKGKIIAVEKNKDRFQSLLKMVNTSGAQKLVKCFLKDVTHFYYNDAEKINLVLVDVPCSGSGMRNRLGETDSNEGRLRSLQWVQMKILTKALTDYPEAERVLYCTCSINSEENEAVVQRVIDDCGENLQFKLSNCHKIIKGYSKGSSDYECGPFCLRVDPAKDLSNGFFVALFERSNKICEPLIETDDTQESTNDELKVKKRKKKSKTDDQPTSTDASPQQKGQKKKKKIKNTFTVSSEDTN